MPKNEGSKGLQVRFRGFRTQALKGVLSGFVGVSMGLRGIQGHLNSVMRVYGTFQRVTRGLS